MVFTGQWRLPANHRFNSRHKYFVVARGEPEDFDVFIRQRIFGIFLSLCARVYVSVFYAPCMATICHDSNLKYFCFLFNRFGVVELSFFFWAFGKSSGVAWEENTYKKKKVFIVIMWYLYKNRIDFTSVSDKLSGRTGSIERIASTTNVCSSHTKDMLTFSSHLGILLLHFTCSRERATRTHTTHSRDTSVLMCMCRVGVSPWNAKILRTLLQRIIQCKVPIAVQDNFYAQRMSEEMKFIFLPLPMGAAVGSIRYVYNS